MEQRLSLCEQQRLTVARAVLFEPDWLLLDEATASLDEPAERIVYRLLRERLPYATIVSVGHRSTLRALHDRSVDIEDGSSVEVYASKGASRPQLNAHRLAVAIDEGNITT